MAGTRSGWSPTAPRWMHPLPGRRSLSSGERRQTSEEIIEEPRRFEVFVESLSGVGAPPDLLAVGRDRVFGVRSHPVEASTARDDVPRRRPVVDEESVVAVSA